MPLRRRRYNDRSEKLDNMKFDYMESTLANMFWLIKILCISLLMMGCINIVAGSVDEVIRFIGTVMVMFFAVQLFRWVGHPSLIFIHRRNNERKVIRTQRY